MTTTNKLPSEIVEVTLKLTPRVAQYLWAVCEALSEDPGELAGRFLREGMLVWYRKLSETKQELLAIKAKEVKARDAQNNLTKTRQHHTHDNVASCLDPSTGQWEPDHDILDCTFRESPKRAARPNQATWRSVVINRDKECLACGTVDDLAAHHLDSYNWNSEARDDVTNGITLCQPCHRDFHRRYGRGYNTKGQYAAWTKYRRLLDCLDSFQFTISTGLKILGAKHPPPYRGNNKTDRVMYEVLTYSMDNLRSILQEIANNE